MTAWQVFLRDHPPVRSCTPLDRVAALMSGFLFSCHLEPNIGCLQILHQAEKSDRHWRALYKARPVRPLTHNIRIR